LIDMSQQQRAAKGIIVLGMHRSGTSCVGGLLHAMGAYFGPPDMDLGANAENPKGFWERQDLNWACEFALLAAGGSWWQPALPPVDFDPGAALLRRAFAAIRPELDRHAPWFIKDPRLCLLLDTLREDLGEVVYIHVVRDPVEVALSLSRRNGLSIGHALALWELYTNNAFAATVSSPRYLLDYAALLHDPFAGTSDLLSFLLDNGVRGIGEPDRAAIEHWIDPTLRREQRKQQAPGFLNGVQMDLQTAIESGAILREVHARAISGGAQAELRHQAEVRCAVAGLGSSADAHAAGALAALIQRGQLQASVLDQSLERSLDALTRRQS
jgi:Sulfotransferase family